MVFCFTILSGSRVVSEEKLTSDGFHRLNFWGDTLAGNLYGSLASIFFSTVILNEELGAKVMREPSILM